MNWKQSEEWTAESGDRKYIVKVKHWIAEWAAPEIHKWNVYAYVKKGHRLFVGLAAADGDDHAIFSEASLALPLHCGATYYKAHRDKAGDCYCVEVGSDYGHLHDDAFGHMATKDDAYRVFMDAEELFNFLAIPAPEVSGDAGKGEG